MLNQAIEQESVREYSVNPLLMSTFSIIIPAYNEEKRIEPVLKEISGFIYNNRLPWEVIVAVDGNDETENIVMKYREKYPFINSKKSSARSGMGGAIKRGILTSTGEIVLLMDGDGSANLEDMVRKVDLLDTFDIVNFNRYSSPENRIPFKRRFASRMFNLILKAVFAVPVYDTQCGYKIMKRSVVMPIVRRLTVSNAFFLSAFFIYAKKNSANIVEVPIRYAHSDGSKFNVIMTSISYLVSISAFKIRNSNLYDYTPKFVKELYYKKLRYL